MKKIRLKKGFIYQKTGNKITIFDGEESTLHTFNKSASFIFDKIKQGVSEDKLIDLLVKRHSISRSTAEADVKEFMDELKRKRIIT